MAGTGLDRGIRKKRSGVVIADKMDKTIAVRVERRVRHKLYGKETRMLTKLYAHDEKNEAKVGDKVTVVETKPISRMKRWRLVDIVK